MRPWALIIAGLAFTCSLTIAAMGCGSELEVSSSPPADSSASAPNRWTKLGGGGDSPPGRQLHSMTYVPNTGKLLVFGGLRLDLAGNKAIEYDDLWSYDLIRDQWDQVPTEEPHPSARYGAAMIHEPTTGQVVLFGGYSMLGPDPNTFYDRVFTDTWMYDATNNRWRECEPEGTIPDAPGVVTYDSDSNRVVMVSSSRAATGALTNRVWAYDARLDRWEEIETPSDRPEGREGHGVVYDGGNHRLVLFGGRSETALLNDVWGCDLRTGSWTRIEASGAVPPPSVYQKFFAGPAGAALLLEQIHDPGSLPLVFQYDLGEDRWTQFERSSVSYPPPRAEASVAYNDEARCFMLFGGAWSGEPEAPVTHYDDIWRYSLAP